MGDRSTYLPLLYESIFSIYRQKGSKPMQLKVVKFGGSSLADAAHFKQVADIIKADPTRRSSFPPRPASVFLMTPRSQICSIIAMR